MSYQVLARKWRPGKFSELVGQEHVVSAISNALDNDRLHHAYLFTGTRGVGKTTIARIFSKSLNCEEGQGANPCGQCNTCKEIEQGNFVDLLEIDAASRTKVEDTRELLDNVQYKPSRGRFKVYLIDEVHMLSKHSFNALLKTLEEPPPHVKFLLATTDPQKLPVTILSRCLQFNLKALSREQIVGQLTHILQQESLDFEAPALSLLARAAQGSMRDALSLTDQAIAQGGNAVMAGVVTDMLGLMDKNQLLKLLHAVVTKTPADVMAIVEDMADQAPDYDQVHAELGSMLHQIALTQWVPEACKLETTSAKAIYQLAKSIPAEQVQLLYQITLQGRKDLPFAADGRSALEMTLLRMMTFAPDTPIPDPQSEISNGEVSPSLPISRTDVSSAASDAVQDSLNSEPHLESDPHQSEGSVTVSEATPETRQGLHDAFQEDNHRDENTKPTAYDATRPHNNQTQEGEDGHITLAVNSASQHEHQHESAQPLQQNENDTNHYGGDTLPLDAYFDDAPAQSDDEYNGDSALAAHASPALPQTPQVDDSVSNTSSASPEEQLTSTADMLALRQRLKQRREEGLTSAVKKSEAVNETDDFVSRLSRAKDEERRSRQDTDEPQPASPAVAQTTDHNDPPPWNVGVGSDESYRDDDYHADHDADTPFAVASDMATSNDSAQTPLNDKDNSAHTDLVDDAAPNNVAEQDLNRQAPDNHHVTHENYDSGFASNATSFNATTSGEYENNTFDNSGSSTAGYKGPLTAYLNDGQKLLHASQIDAWSNLVEQMPVAGLLKQLVLHAAFKQENNQITLEIDNSQAHLLNENNKAQLVSALHQCVGNSVNVDIVLGTPDKTPFGLQQEIQGMRHAHAHTVIKTDETIQSLLSTFDASVITDTVKAR
ncbi:DNA polymerase III subunit gamma/tau [Alteromonas sp. A079]|uniref:DNA polymerase III subunit gamma/tau n=1 Tax=Alteromonas sp. A079 TaxID=3410268 RepID=UPI003BA1D3A3